jgi:Lipopolysaccharide export system permease LptF/LptG
LVVLEGVSIVTYATPEKAEQMKGDDPRRKTPREFIMASTALISIGESERDDDVVELYVSLEGGTKFPRQFKGGMQAGIGATQFGPIEISSPIKEDTKFMDVLRLKHLYDNPEESRRIRGTLSGLIRHDQAVAYLRSAAAELNGPNRACSFEDREGNRIMLTRHPSSPAASVGGQDGEELLVIGHAAATTNPALQPAIAFSRTGERTLSQLANELRVRVRPDSKTGEGLVTVELMGRRPAGGGRAVSSNFSDTIQVKLPEQVVKLKDRRLAQYLDKNSNLLTKSARSKLNRDTVVLNNNILSESHGRMSFAVSCFILVLVGCALGMMFRSGNFLTAFAVSFIPALLCITLIVSGQQTCQAVPWALDQAGNPLKMGLALIWSGNAINGLLATALLWRLQRQ